MNSDNYNSQQPKRRKLNKGNIFVTMAQPKIHTTDIPTLPTDKTIALYGRQSTLFQVLNNTQSYDYQVEQQKEIIQKYGWKEERIVEYFQDFAVSGTLGIGERIGITKLTEDITAGKVKAVYVQLVDHLFRDRNLENVVRFANVCQDNGVVIITSMRFYHMNNRYDWDYFIEDCKRAWEQFDVQINQRMLPMRAYASHRGYYDARVLNIGYTVDRDRRSPTYKKYILHPEQAKVIVWLYKRFIELGGNIPALMRELAAMPGYHFPKYEDPKMHSRCELKKVEGGYRIAAHKTVKRLLTNEAYLGIWKTGEASYPNNHEAIIDKDTWDTVQYLIEKSEGKQSTRRHGEASIIQGLVMRPSKDYTVALDTVKDQVIFSYVPAGEPYPTAYQYIKLSTIEDLFISVFTKRIEEDKNTSEIGQTAHEIYEREQKNKEHMKKTMEGLQAKHDRIYEDLEDEDIAASMSKQTKKKKYEDIAALEEEIAKLQEAIDTPSEGLPLIELTKTLDALRQKHKELPKDRLQQVIRMFTKGIELKALSSHFWGFAIHWEIWGIDSGMIWFNNASRYKWDDEDHKKLQEMYQAGATTEEYMHAFPSCSLSALATRLQRATGHYVIQQQVHSPHFKLSLKDRHYIQMLEERGHTLEQIVKGVHDKVYFIEHLTPSQVDERKAGYSTEDKTTGDVLEFNWLINHWYCSSAGV